MNPSIVFGILLLAVLFVIIYFTTRPNPDTKWISKQVESLPQIVNCQNTTGYILPYTSTCGFPPIQDPIVSNTCCFENQCTSVQNLLNNQDCNFQCGFISFTQINQFQNNGINIMNLQNQIDSNIQSILQTLNIPNITIQLSNVVLDSNNSGVCLGSSCADSNQIRIPLLVNYTLQLSLNWNGIPLQFNIQNFGILLTLIYNCQSSQAQITDITIINSPETQFSSNGTALKNSIQIVLKNYWYVITELITRQITTQFQLPFNITNQLDSETLQYLSQECVSLTSTRRFRSKQANCLYYIDFSLLDVPTLLNQGQANINQLKNSSGGVVGFTKATLLPNDIQLDVFVTDLSCGTRPSQPFPILLSCLLSDFTLTKTINNTYSITFSQVVSYPVSIYQFAPLNISQFMRNLNQYLPQNYSQLTLNNLIQNANLILQSYYPIFITLPLNDGCVGDTYGNIQFLSCNRLFNPQISSNVTNALCLGLSNCQINVYLSSLNLGSSLSGFGQIQTFEINPTNIQFTVPFTLPTINLPNVSIDAGFIPEFTINLSVDITLLLTCQINYQCPNYTGIQVINLSVPSEPVVNVESTSVWSSFINTVAGKTIYDNASSGIQNAINSNSQSLLNGLNTRLSKINPNFLTQLLPCPPV